MPSKLHSLLKWISRKLRSTLQGSQALLAVQVTTLLSNWYTFALADTEMHSTTCITQKMDPPGGADEEVLL